MIDMVTQFKPLFAFLSLFASSSPTWEPALLSRETIPYILDTLLAITYAEVLALLVSFPTFVAHIPNSQPWVLASMAHWLW